jgi:acetylglutamate kinase
VATFANVTGAPLVVKFGGELLEERDRLRTVVDAMAAVAARGQPLAIVHGGGKEIDRALQQAGLEKRQVDGLRITDEPTRDIVVAVLAGSVNTRVVAALTTAGAPAVGLTGADAGCGRATVAPPHRTLDGQLVDLGLVGGPSDQADGRLLHTLIGGGFVPVIACIGLDAAGRLLNMNADTFAGDVAARLRARRLIVAGTTPGVLDADGRTVPVLDRAGVESVIGDRTATAGMVAKLRACTHALAHGVTDVLIVDGRDGKALERAAAGETPEAATRLIDGPVPAR